MDDHWYRRGLFWPVLLVLAGAVLLLNNLGLLEWNFWELLFRLWPVILVAIGIDLLIPKRSAGGYALALVLILAVFAGGYWLLSTAEPATNRGVEVYQALSQSTAASMSVKPAVGELRIHGGAPSGVLARGFVSTLGRGQVNVQRSQSGGRAVLELAHEFGSGAWIFFPDSRSPWDLTITGAIPVDLEAELGAGLMELDLAEVQLTNVNADIGVGEIELRLSAGPVDASVSGGVGQLRIVLPLAASARIQVSRGLVALNLPDGYRLENGIATSPAARGESAMIQIRVDLGVGSISVVESAN